MAEPVATRILNDIETALRGIKRTAGYQLDMRVQRLQSPWQPDVGDLTCAVFLDDIEKDDAASLDLDSWRMTVYAVVVLIEPQSSSREAEERQMMAWADIVKAIRADPRRGGLATDTIHEAPVLMDDRILIGITVHFDTILDDLTRSRGE